MTAERALLERAAKAAGTNIDFNDALDFSGAPKYFDNDTGDWWNPLHADGDGDALRLAVKLRITVQFPWDEQQRRTGEICTWTDDADPLREELSPDPYAATRLAIVRAAASMAGGEGG